MSLEFIIIEGNCHQRWVDALDGECRLLSLKDVYTQDLPLKGAKGIIQGPVTTSLYLQKELELKPGLFYDHEEFKYTRYFSHWSNSNIQKSWGSFTFGHLKSWDFRRLLWVMSGEKVFIRPNANTKTFNGQIVSEYHYQEFVDTLERSGADPSMEIIICPYQEIEAEWRCFMYKGEYLTGSRYMVWGDPDQDYGVPAYISEYAESIPTFNGLPDFYCLDIGQVDDKIGIVELTSLSFAGVYQSDVKKITDKLKEIYDGQ